MSLTPQLVQELLDENRAHECDDFGGEVRFLEQIDRPVVAGMTSEQVGALHQSEEQRNDR